MPGIKVTFNIDAGVLFKHLNTNILQFSIALFKQRRVFKQPAKPYTENIEGILPQQLTTFAAISDPSSCQSSFTPFIKPISMWVHHSSGLVTIIPLCFTVFGLC